MAGNFDPDLVRLADLTSASSYQDFALVDLAGGGLSDDAISEIRRAAYSETGRGAAAPVRVYHARQMAAALLRSSPEVADPDAWLANEADFLSFAAGTMPDLGERELRQRATPAWRALRYAAGTIEGARDWLTILGAASDPPPAVMSGSVWRSRGEIKRIAGLPLRFVLPHDHEVDGIATPWLDLDSLHGTLDDLLADGYPKAAKIFHNLGKISLDLLARFTNQQLPHREPLPTLPARA